MNVALSMTNYKRNFLFRFLLTTIFSPALSCLSSCSTQKYISSVSYSFKSRTGKPDYSNLNYWAAHPDKYDPSDNVSFALKEEKKDTLADVFFIYPTSYTDEKMPMGWNADIDSKEINRKTDDNRFFTRQVYLINIAGYLLHDTDKLTFGLFTLKMNKEAKQPSILPIKM